MDTLHGKDITTRIDQLMNVNARFHGTMKSFGVASLLTALAQEKHLANEESVRRGNAGPGALEITNTEVRNAEQIRTQLLNQIRNDLAMAFNADGKLNESWVTIDPSTPLNEVQPEYAGVGAGITTGQVNWPSTSGPTQGSGVGTNR